MPGTPPPVNTSVGSLVRACTASGLRQAHRPENLRAVMCRSLISVSWTGALYDCDFNQQLNLSSGSGPRQLADLLRAVDGLIDQPIAVAEHCFGCTAGNGSSCGGALS